MRKRSEDVGSVLGEVSIGELDAELDRLSFGPCLIIIRTRQATNKSPAQFACDRPMSVCLSVRAWVGLGHDKPMFEY